MHEALNPNGRGDRETEQKFTFQSGSHIFIILFSFQFYNLCKRETLSLAYLPDLAGGKPFKEFEGKTLLDVHK